MNDAEHPAPSWRVLLHLAWPIVVSRSAQVVIGFSDAAMVARLGEDALAATTTGSLNVFSFFIFSMGIVFIVSSFASQLFGKGDYAGARRYGWYGLAVAAFAQVLALVGVPILATTLSHFSYTESVQTLMTDYMKIRLYAGGAAIGLEAIANYYGGLGNTRLPMIAQILAMVLNIGLNWVLIYGNLGAPAMGVQGAAWASAISTVLAFLFLFTCFYKGFGARGGKQTSPLKFKELRRMLRFGIPSGLNWFFEFAAFAFFINVVVGGLGTSVLAAFMAVMQINSIAFMPAFGIGAAGSILVGQAIGAKKHDQVPGIVWLTAKTAGIWQGSAGLLYVFAPGLLISAFTDPEKTQDAFVQAGVRMLMLSSVWQLADAAGIVLSEALRAAGDTAFCLWARLSVSWLVFVPGVLLSVRVFGGGDVVAVAWMAGYILLLAVIMAIRFRGGAWRRLDLAGHEPTVE